MNEVLTGRNPKADEALARDLGVTLTGEVDTADFATKPKSFVERLKVNFDEMRSNGEQQGLLSAERIILKEMSECCESDRQAEFKLCARLLDALKVEQDRVEKEIARRIMDEVGL